MQESDFATSRKSAITINEKNKNINIDIDNRKYFQESTNKNVTESKNILNIVIVWRQIMDIMNALFYSNPEWQKKNRESMKSLIELQETNPELAQTFLESDEATATHFLNVDED